jgi:hypothetical protein
LPQIAESGLRKNHTVHFQPMPWTSARAEPVAQQLLRIRRVNGPASACNDCSPRPSCCRSRSGAHRCTILTHRVNARCEPPYLATMASTIAPSHIDCKTMEKSVVTRLFTRNPSRCKPPYRAFARIAHMIDPSNLSFATGESSCSVSLPHSCFAPLCRPPHSLKRHLPRPP